MWWILFGTSVVLLVVGSQGASTLGSMCLGAAVGIALIAGEIKKR